MGKERGLSVDSSLSMHHTTTVDWEELEDRYIFHVPSAWGEAWSAYQNDPTFHFAVVVFAERKSVHPEKVLSDKLDMLIHIDKDLINVNYAPEELQYRSNSCTNNTTEIGDFSTKSYSRSTISGKSTNMENEAENRSTNSSITEKFTKKIKMVFTYF